MNAEALILYRYLVMCGGGGHAVGAAADQTQLLADVRLLPRALALELLLNSVEITFMLNVLVSSYMSVPMTGLCLGILLVS